MPAAGITQKRKGALADGSAAKKVHTAIEEMNDDVAQEVYDAVKKRLSAVLVNPTGYYESRVQVDRSQGEATVNDGGVIYGPWLEGTSSRNGRSRFKGYATFRRATQDADTRAKAIAEKALDRKLGGLK